jgi:Domain of unknown function (DUF4333)
MWTTRFSTRARALGASIAAMAVVVALAVAGCGETVIDSGKAEGAVKENLQHVLSRRVASVECPSGVAVKPKASFECAVRLAGGETKTATLTILDTEADTEVTGLRAGAPR